ncbi:uncharacterized protein H6S33_002224 [Morchella sextelata]|uniref:uncharacterized protein n=1 Tax=Morchella sextelata TaxID=1174677 RepID=UPI001D0406BD|nr:uncharacterized protein H6S33_002224 [Morchella sextelata]KAH0608172.1 hypothetical protein H6S33_002224 [Morchella sextelata]
MPQAPLAPKDASLFRQVLKCYETKQYKKGLKAAEQILKRNPHHGETLAMKGLITNSLGRTTEAFTIAKEALKQDMKSHVCWHVYGLLYRSTKNFEESIKAYKMALRFEPESQQILRDLALLQIQMRDYVGYIESRRQILQGRPQLRQNWTGLAIAQHLAGSYAEAENVMVKFEETLKVPVGKGDVEHSEAGLYKNMIIAESGDIERALTDLEKISKTTLDKISVLEKRAEYLLKLERKEEAVGAYKVLLERNAEKRAYYQGLEKAMGCEEDTAARKALYAEYAEKNQRSDAPRRIPLDFLSGDEFREAADVYLTKLLKKGVPSTFANVKALYADAEKRATILELVQGYAASLENEEPQVVETPTNGDANGDESAKTTKPSEFKLWTLYFLGQHYDHYRTRNTERSLEYINKALELKPEQVELHMTLARIYKHAGNLQKAMEKMNEARNFDKKDRYINTKCAKYQLRNDHNEEALETMSLFTRNDAHGGPLGDLLEMQCVWFITEDGESYLRQGKFGLALKRFHAILKIFEDWTDDQFDFHSFSLRKGQIRSYVEMLRWEDALRSHPFFSRAALGAIKAYIMLSDRPHLAHSSLSNGNNKKVDFEGLSIADRKKALKKAKREAQKAQERAVEAAAKAKEEKAKNAQVANLDEEKKKDDTDPLGTELAQTKEPLEAALKFLNPLLEFSPGKLEVQTSGFEIHSRRKKWLLSVKCLRAAQKLDPESPVVHEQIIRFRTMVSKLSDEDIKAPSKEILISTLEEILPAATDLTAYNDEFSAKHSQSAPHIRGALRARRFLNADTPTTPLFDALDQEGISLYDVLQGQSLLQELKAPEEKIKEYNQKAAAKFPDAVVFREKAGTE